MKKVVLIILILSVFLSSISAKNNGKQKLANKYLKRAEKYFENKDYFLAHRYFERAYRKFKIIGHHKGQYLSLKGLGDVNMQKGYLDRAFDMYNRAKYFAHKSGMVYSLSYVTLCRNIARVHESHRYYGNAISFMKIAVSIGAKIGDPSQNYNVSYLSKLIALRKKYGKVGH